MYYVYKYIDPKTKECLYVGQTKDLNQRHLLHLKNKKEPWCTRDLHLYYIEVPEKYNLNFLEIYFINLEKPKYNIAGIDAMDVSFTQVKNIYEWKQYRESIYEDMEDAKPKKKLTLNVEQNYVNTLKIKAIQYDLTTSELIEIFAVLSERDKKVFNELVDKYKPEVIKNRNVKKKSDKKKE